LDSIFAKTHGSTYFEDASRLNHLTSTLSAPMGFTLSIQQEIWGATVLKCAQVYDECPAL